MHHSLALALIADIHHGADLGTKIGSAALGLLDQAIGWANEHPIDMLVELGDRINNLDIDTDLSLTAAVGRAFDAVRAPRAHILGNHDNHDLSREQAESAMQHSFASWGCDVRGHRLVFWNADTCLAGRAGFSFGPGDLAWLERELANTELPTVVFTHVPLDSGSMIGNFYFERHFAALAHYPDSAAARDIIERSGKVILCVSGHSHWNACNTIDGIHYVTIHSLTESFTTWPHPTGAHALLRMGEWIEIEVFGRDPAFYRLPIRRPGAHWASLTRDFAPRPRGIDVHVRQALALHHLDDQPAEPALEDRGAY